MNHFEVWVAQRREVDAGVVELELRPAAGGSMPGYMPGAHVDLVMPEGITRACPLAQPASAEPVDHYVVAVGLASDSPGGSHKGPEFLKVGDRLQVGAPMACGEGGADRPFEVTLVRQQRTLTVPAGTSLLDALESAGVIVPSVCREGHCGSCECGVVDGEVDHRDQILGPDERAAHQTMMVCVSRARGRHLVLDL